MNLRKSILSVVLGLIVATIMYAVAVKIVGGVTFPYYLDLILFWGTWAITFHIAYNTTMNDFYQLGRQWEKYRQ